MTFFFSKIELQISEFACYWIWNEISPWRLLRLKVWIFKSHEKRKRYFLIPWLNIKGNFKNICLKDYNLVHFWSKDSQIFFDMLWKLGFISPLIKNGMASNLLVESREHNVIPVSAGLGFTATSRFYVLYFGKFIFRTLRFYESTVFTEETTRKVLK